MTEVQSGLEGVVAFATEIAEPDKEGGALRYRGVDIEDLVGAVPYEKVWGLLVDGSFEPGPQPGRAASAARPLAATSASTCRRRWRCSRPSGASASCIDITDEQARDRPRPRLGAWRCRFVAQSARGLGQPWVPQHGDRRGRRRSPSAS